MGSRTFAGWLIDRIGASAPPGHFQRGMCTWYWQSAQVPTTVYPVASDAQAREVHSGATEARILFEGVIALGLVQINADVTVGVPAGLGIAFLDSAGAVAEIG